MNESKTRKRPIAVWIVSVFYIFTSTLLLLFTCLSFSGAVSIPPEEMVRLNSLTGIDYLFIIAQNCMYLAAAIALFRLRNLFAILLGISIATIEIECFFEIECFYATIFDWLLLLTICIYTWSLKQRRVLR